MPPTHIITLGKLKEIYWQQAEAEYIKRLGPTSTVAIHELKEEPFSEKDPPELIKAREAKKIMAALEKIKDTFVLVLNSSGRPVTSLQLATLTAAWRQEYHALTVIIGGPLGLDPSIIAIGQRPGGFMLSLSHLTFTHQMARIIILEQLYRAGMITSNRTYHY